jgi:hypothetical protein
MDMLPNHADLGILEIFASLWLNIVPDMYCCRLLLAKTKSWRDIITAAATKLHYIMTEAGAN